MKSNSSISQQLNLKQLFPFELDDFQKNAIAALNADKSVVVCAPTGSGKTLIGEYAIHRALSRGKRVFYTTPLKALSNQKFRDFKQQFAQENPKRVGLITGDILINPDADVVIMTTEIFRNMLYETPVGQVGTSLKAVDAVVLDECHYLGDRFRGTVWEESIIYCPADIQLVALSATIGNPEELTDWMTLVRSTNGNNKKYSCELINSDFRPVPLRFWFCAQGKSGKEANRSNLYPLLDSKQEKLNPKLKALLPKQQGKKRRLKIKDCPKTHQIVQSLKEKDMLPAIYIIFSRMGCDRAVQQLDYLVLVTPEESRQIEQVLLRFFLGNNPDLQQALIEYLATTDSKLQNFIKGYLANNSNAVSDLFNYLNENPNQRYLLWQFLTEQSQVIKIEQVEPLLRGIASHHAGLLPAWKELVENLFELGLVKVVFATATLAAGINMPARTTVISALSKRTSEGHSMLTPSEFLQIAGRAGRRGKDEVGYVVTIQSPFEGAKEAAFLATSDSEDLRSRFTPSYGMVLNLLQKHSLSEAKELLEKSFAEYLAQKKLAPEQQAIADITINLAKLDIELAPISLSDLNSYQKIRGRIKEEQRLLSILQQQAEATQKKVIKPLISLLSPGKIVGLKGKHIRVNSPLAAVVVTKVPGSGKADDLVCLGANNTWYLAANGDIAEINQGLLPQELLTQISLPNLDNCRLGKIAKGQGDTNIIAGQIIDYVLPTPAAPEVREQQDKIETLLQNIDVHPLERFDNPGSIIKKHQKRLSLTEKLHRTQIKYQKHKSNQSYYWDDFLNLIKVLQEFKALDGYNPTELGKAAATIRGDNELWLALAIMSGELEYLEPHHLAAAICALISESPRADTWCEYAPPIEVLETLGIQKRESGSKPTSILREIRPQLFQTQHRYGVNCPIWREYELIGLCEQWALGIDWNELCDSTNLAEGDIVRMLRRTIDVLWQIPQVPNISGTLLNNARDAISGMKRFPI